MTPALPFPGTHNAARRVIDGMSHLGDLISTNTAEPTRAVSAYLADQVAPSYWQPNAEARACSAPRCRLTFAPADRKHHCRKCGKVFCGECTRYWAPVPERGWGNEPQKCCKTCYDQR